MRYQNKEDLKIVYMGTPEISALVLKNILDAGFNVVAVISNEDKEIGRKRIKSPTPVKQVALEHDIPVYQPARIKNDHDFLSKIDFDVLLTMAYGQIVPEDVLKAPKVGAINLHGSLLPSYRGAAPIQRAIIDGLKVTGVSLMAMVKEMDAGEVYDAIEVDIAPEDNYSSLQIKIAKAASELAIKDLLAYGNGEIKGVDQDITKVTFAKKILPEEEHLSLNIPSSSLLCYIRGLSEVPGGYFFFDGKIFKVYKASFVSSEVKGQLGEILPDKKRILLQCLDGVISLEKVQLEGKKAMDARSFLNGAGAITGKILG